MGWDPAPKYISAQGSTRNYPYPRAAPTIPGAPLLVVEGEFDALLAIQVLGERFNVATWSSASADPAKIHVSDEFRALEWYLLFDADQAGRAAAHIWHTSYPTAHILNYPSGVNDFGELVRDPAGLERWLEHLPAANSHLVRNSS